MWVATSPPPRGLPALDDQIVALDGAVDAGGLEPGGDRGEAIALLDPEFMQAPHARRARSECGRDRQDRIFVDHRRGARSGNVDPLERARAHPQVRDLLAAFETFVERLDMRAHLLQRLEEPSPERVHHHPLNDDVGPRNDQSGDEGERRRRWVARNHHGRRTQFRPADERDPSPVFLRSDSDLGAEIGQHFFGVVARGFAFDHGCHARRVEAGKQDGRFDLGRGDRRAIFDRRGIAGALENDRTASAFGLGENLTRP